MRNWITRIGALIAWMATGLAAAEKNEPGQNDPEPAMVWARQVGTAADDFGKALAVDREGHCYVGGYTCGDLAAKNAGKQDAVVVAFDPAGQRLWMVQLGTPEDDAVASIALAPDGSLYVGGTTRGRLGSSAFGGSDVFAAKLDRAGHMLWLRQYGTAADDSGARITCDARGGVFLTGSTAGVMGGKALGGEDAFLLKIDAAGAPVWTCQWGTAATEGGSAVAADAEGSLYVTGSTTGSFDGSANAGSLDIFVSKIDRAGNLVWTKQFGTPAPENGLNLLVDAARNIYVGGSSAGDFAGPQSGGGDAVLLKLSGAGELVWKKQFGTTRWDGIHGLAFLAGAAERVVVGGCQNWDQCQGFLREFDPDGREQWQTRIPTDQVLCGTQIGVDGQGNIYQTGGTHGPAFGEYQGVGTDIVVVKFSQKQ